LCQSRLSINPKPHQLLQNGKTSHRQRQTKLKRQEHENHHFDDAFTGNELRNSLKHLKNGIAAGFDEIPTEEIKHFGPITRTQ
ncbi:MAG: hypothetical protein M3H12_12115, partial [Chromatiales bacterium]